MNESRNAAAPSPKPNRKRGVAIEMALSMLVVVFALCTLLVTLAAYSRTDNTKQNRAFADSVAVDQIGEDFLAALNTAVQNGTQSEFDFDNNGGMYTTTVDVTTDGTIYILRVYTTTEHAQKLEVRAQVAPTGCRILSWSH